MHKDQSLILKKQDKICYSCIYRPDFLIFLPNSAAIFLYFRPTQLKLRNTPDFSYGTSEVRSALCPTPYSLIGEFRISPMTLPQFARKQPERKPCNG